MSKLQSPCIKCGSTTTYTRPEGREEWKKAPGGRMCKSCRGKELRSISYVPHPRTKLKGPCQRCGSSSTAIEKSGYAHWHRGQEGTICRRCYNREHEAKEKDGLCSRCGKTKTKQHWHNMPEGKICQKCYKTDYQKIQRGGNCPICGTTKSNSWAITIDGRICGKCKSKRSVREIKRMTLHHYSKGLIKCANCGYNKNINALELDHIQGKGNLDRKLKGKDGGWAFYRILIKSSYPEGYQVLCSNCNRIKQIENS